MYARLSLRPADVSANIVFAPIHRFAAMLALVLMAIFAFTPPLPNGDFVEYGVTTAAFARHATPSLHYDDLDDAKRLSPPHAQYYDKLAQGIAAGEEIPLFGFNRSHQGRYFAIHPWGYSALAAPAYVVLQAVGLPPLKCFQFINLAMVFVLGLCAYRLFGSSWRAAVALVLFVLCGGALYWNWCSPECMSAAALLGSLILFSTGAPLRAGLLAGLAAMQNPSIVFVAAFAPFLTAAVHHEAEGSWRRALAQCFTLRYAAALAIIVVLFAMPFLFSQWQFGVPSLIKKYATSPDFITWNRLHSLFLDLNQGMLVGVPALMAAVLLGGWRRRTGWITAVCVVMVLALVFPALSARNWNSGAAGMMRYAFWASMPLLFAMLMMLRRATRWPHALVAAVVLVQAGAMWHAHLYDYVDMSPLAREVLERNPALYNPDPEIFSDRSSGGEVTPEKGKVYVFKNSAGVALKTMYHREQADIGAVLCGPGRSLASTNRLTGADGGFVYISGPVACAGQ